MHVSLASRPRSQVVSVPSRLSCIGSAQAAIIAPICNRKIAPSNRPAGERRDDCLGANPDRSTDPRPRRDQRILQGVGRDSARRSERAAGEFEVNPAPMEAKPSNMAAAAPMAR
jgi:hypothetical protein